MTSDVPDYGLIVGVPGRQCGWMSRHGVKLAAADSSGVMICPESGFRYKEDESGKLKCLDLDEQARLPEEHRIGKKHYRDIK